MSAPKATPAPWWYDEDTRMVLGGSEATYVCEVSGAASNAQHQADARLIVAAHGLYAELEDAAADVEALAEDAYGTELGDLLSRTARRYRAALAAARGEACVEEWAK